MEYKKNSHAVYDIKYHVIWVTKRVFDSYIIIKNTKSLDNRAFFIGKMSKFSPLHLSNFE